MLEDNERKLLRILYNFFSLYRRMTEWRELSLKTGKTTDELSQILLSLENKQYIYWDNKLEVNSVVMIQGWERKEKTVLPPQESYWTQY